VEDGMKRVWIQDTDIANYLFHRLVEDGYAPEEDELLDLAEYVFDFLMDMSYIESFINETGEEE
jgi:hypothetical protein